MVVFLVIVKTSKYQNPFQAHDAKISAVSTPILTAKATFLNVFFKLFQKNQWKTTETSENVSNLRTKILKVWKKYTF